MLEESEFGILFSNK